MSHSDLPAKETPEPLTITLKMFTNGQDKELDAIHAAWQLLFALPLHARKRAIDYLAARTNGAL